MSGVVQTLVIANVLWCDENRPKSPFRPKFTVLCCWCFLLLLVIIHTFSLLLNLMYIFGHFYQFWCGSVSLLTLLSETLFFYSCDQCDIFSNKLSVYGICMCTWNSNSPREAVPIIVKVDSIKMSLFMSSWMLLLVAVHLIMHRYSNICGTQLSFRKIYSRHSDKTLYPEKMLKTWIWEYSWQ